MRALLWAAIVLCSPAVFGEPCDPRLCIQAPADDGIEILTRVGRVKAPFVTSDLPRVESEFTAARMLVASGHYRLTSQWVAGIRIPTAPSSVRQPGGSYVAENIFGNVELFAELQPQRWRLAGLEIRPALRGGLGLPTAGLGSISEVSENRGLAISNALDGWRLPELYEPGVVPVTVAARVDAERNRLRAFASAKLPWLVRISDGGYPDDAVTRPLGIVPVLEAGASYWPFDWLGAGLSSFVVVQAPAAVAPGRDSDRAGRVQVGIEPALRFAIGSHVLVDTDLALPLGGPLEESLGIGIQVSVFR
jgi:hypothetical protein